MNKTKKIIFVLIATVAIVATLAINVFAYDGFSAYPIICSPSVLVTTNKNGSYREGYLGGLEEAFYYPDNLYSLYSVGSIANSTHIKATSTIFEDGLNGLVYEFTTSNSYEAIIDFGLLPIKSTDTFKIEMSAYSQAVPEDGNIVSQPFAPEIYNIALTFGYVKDDTFHVETVGFPTGDFDAGTVVSLFHSASANTYGHMYLMRLSFTQTPNDEPPTLNLKQYPQRIYNAVILSFSDSTLFTDDGAGSGALTNYTYHAMQDISVFSWNNSSEYFYDEGYRIGHGEGYDEGYTEGESYGYEYGKEIGYEDGYWDAVDDEIEEKGVFSFIFDSVSAFLSFPLFPLADGNSVTLGMILGTIMGALCFVWILKLIAGG